MAILSSISQQPADRLDYTIDYADWLPSDDAVASVVSTVAPTGLDVTSLVTSFGQGVKLWITGGTDGVSYKITITSTTTLGRVKQDELRVKIKDY